jgi:hypothetical protein
MRKYRKYIRHFCNKCNKRIYAYELNELELEEINSNENGSFVCSDCINEEMEMEDRELT